MSPYSWCILYPGDWVELGHSLKSKDGTVEFGVQADGRLVLSHSGQCVFQTEQRNDIKGLKMKRDGNLCLYTTYGKLIWQTDTAYPIGDHSVCCFVQDDGNVVLYRGENAIWSSHTPRDPDHICSGSCRP
ncbi:D-mannose binding lectin [Aspergillus parasiticus SU-1]|uniref:Bulb-type lectin domain-containing protein n=2 Tax=Aspergillus parasiticus TaxID=5067 RepID=A0A5N6DQ62_ASPPA|nr:bulb-type lectin domain-containing protein [Aspergillus parasiticus]KJK67797.1 D-mannose binding lectin [Aspergillus parasiticus SU-1]